MIKWTRLYVGALAFQYAFLVWAAFVLAIGRDSEIQRVFGAWHFVAAIMLATPLTFFTFSAFAAFNYSFAGRAQRFQDIARRYRKNANEALRLHHENDGARGGERLA